MWGRRAGFLLIAFGISMMLFVGYLFYQDNNHVLSPIPDDSGIKVIILSPKSTK